MTSIGTVREWHQDDGWGVIDADETPGGCWVHVASLLTADAEGLVAGQEVHFTFEAGAQDGYAYRALEAWPADREPVAQETTGPSSAFGSRLTVDLGEGDPTPRPDSAIG